VCLAIEVKYGVNRRNTLVPGGLYGVRGFDNAYGDVITHGSRKVRITLELLFD